MSSAYSTSERIAAAEDVARMFSGTDFSAVAHHAASALVDAYFRQFLGLVSGARLKIRIDPFTYSQEATAAGDPVSSRHTTFGKTGAVIMQDTEQVHATLEFDDAKGFATVDANAVTWSSADTTVATVVPDTDGSGGCLIVAGNPGSTTVEVTDGVVSGTVAIDVTPGGVASIKVTLGDPVAQPAPPAPAGP